LEGAPPEADAASAVVPAAAPAPTAPPPPSPALEALRADVGNLRRQHAELNSLVQQWYHSVTQLQQRAAAAAAPQPHPGYGHPAPGGYPGYPPAGYGHPPPGGYGHPGAPHPYHQPQPSPWTEHYTPEGHPYWYNATTGASSWEKPADLAPKRHGGGGGGGSGGKNKGPPGANLFVVRKMRRGEYDDFDDTQLRQHFERFGPMVRCEITYDKDTGISKGFGFVSYDSAEAADAAMAAMNGAMIGGRQIRIEKTSEDGG